MRVGVVELITEVEVGLGSRLGAEGTDGVARAGASASELRGGAAAAVSSRSAEASGLRVGSGARRGSEVEFDAEVGVDPSDVLAGAPVFVRVNGTDATGLVGAAPAEARPALGPVKPVPFERSSLRIGGVPAGELLDDVVDVVEVVEVETVADELEGPVASGGRRTAGGVPLWLWPWKDGRGGSVRLGMLGGGLLSSSSPGRGPALRRRMTIAGVAGWPA